MASKRMSFSIIEVLFVLCIALKPVYLTKSGSLQISDYLIVALTALLIFIRRGDSLAIPQSNKWFIVFLVTLAYQFLITCIWSDLCTKNGTNEENMFKYILYYVFNFVFVFDILQMSRLYSSDRVIAEYMIGILIASIIAFVSSVLNYGGDDRTTGLFNNPNQLGFFALISLSSAFLFKNKVDFKIFVPILVCSIGSILVSLSKAAIISAVVVLFVGIVDSKRSKYPILMFLLAILVIGVTIYFVLYSSSSMIIQNNLLMSLRERIFTMTKESDSNLGTGRGYDRVAEIGLNVIFGVGEGNYGRFSVLKKAEVHSLYANTLVSYGIVGFAGYSFLMCSPLYKSRKIAYFLGIALYCFTHNGIRNSLLWALIGLVMAMSLTKKEVAYGRNCYGQRYM